MTQKYVISKTLTIGMVMENLWMYSQHYWLSRFPLANWCSWLEWRSRSREHWPETNKNKPQQQPDKLIVLFISPYYNINFYSSNLRMQNSEMQLHIKVIPPDPKVTVLVRWGSHINEHHHITYNDYLPSYVSLYMMIGGLCGNLKPTVSLMAYWDISGHTRECISQDNMRQALRPPWLHNWVAK